MILNRYTGCILLFSYRLQKLNNQPELQLTPAWSPLSKKITYTAGAAIDRHEIWTLDLENGSLKQITLDARGFKFDPAFSPEADIAYSAEHNGNYDLWVINKGTDKPRQLTSDRSYDGQPSWSPDGKQLAFSSLRGGEKRLWIMGYAGGEARPITPMGTLSRGPAWYQ